MASRATSRRGRAGTVKHMCSINATGVVFVNSKALDVCSELTLSIQTHVLGLTREWTVQGWVVECRVLGGGFQVTLLFSDLPKGLQQSLALVAGDRVRAYPQMSGAEVFGLN